MYVRKTILRGHIFKFHLIAVLIYLYFIIFLVLVLNLARIEAWVFPETCALSWCMLRCFQGV